MRRFIVALLLVLAAAAPLSAQIGKQVLVMVGTPEDRALTEINRTSDPAQKLQLIEKFYADFGKGDTALLAYELFMNYYLNAKDFDKVLEYGEKSLALDPENFNAAVTMFRAAQDKRDVEKMFDLGKRITAIITRYKQLPAPEGYDADPWNAVKTAALEKAQPNLNYVEYALFSLGNQAQDRAQKIAYLERFLTLFPDSQYTRYAEGQLAAIFQLTQEYPKMLANAQKVLARDPDNVNMLLLLADYYSEKGEELDKAEQYARKVIDLLNKAEKPAEFSDEQWQKQKSLQLGVAQSALGQALINRDKLQEALDAFTAAKELLRDNLVIYARNLYRLGFTLAKMKRPADARTVLTEAVSIDSPYKALAQDTLDRLGPARPAKKRP
jgi:tetratricopeptide (TPR) repeat protein